MKSLSIVTPTFNRAGLLPRCYDSLKAQTCGDFEWIIIDDGSTDGTAEAVRATFPHVHVIQGNGKLFWAKSMRLAWEIAASHCDYDYYLWLNDDLISKPDAINDALIDQRKLKGVVVGACSEDSSETRCSYGATDADDKLIFPSGKPQLAHGWLNGNFVLIPKDIFKKVGYISNDYAHARADYDYAERLKKIGAPFYCSSKYVGICHNDSKKEIDGKSIIQRVGLLWAHGYYNIHDLWLIRSRYHGVLRAIVSCLHLIWIVVKGS